MGNPRMHCDELTEKKNPIQMQATVRSLSVNFCQEYLETYSSYWHINAKDMHKHLIANDFCTVLNTPGLNSDLSRLSICYGILIGGVNRAYLFQSLLQSQAQLSARVWHSAGLARDRQSIKPNSAQLRNRNHGMKKSIQPIKRVPAAEYSQTENPQI